jgi:WD40 repeat protein
VTTATAPATPYKGLAAFDDSELDALLFFGRERDTEVIAANLLASRFTVLYGAPGAGKSSVLRAGVVRRVRTLAPESAVVFHNSWSGDPRHRLAAAVRDALPGAEPHEADLPLADRLAERLDRIEGHLYLVLDQFEEAFVYRDADALADELSEIVMQPKLRIHVLLALRDDALSELSVFTGRIPDVFGNYLTLDRLDRTSGRLAITGPIDRYNELSPEQPIRIEPQLVDAVLDEVAVGRVVLDGVARGTSDAAREVAIEASYLQLVMQRLWEAEQARGSTVLRRATLDELGGAEEIVRGHLERAVGVLAPREQDIAARAFDHLVTPSGTKIAHRVSDLAQYAGVPESELGRVLTSLGAERILRPLDGRFEIFHDVLADAVLAWRTRHEAERAVELERAESQRRHRRLLALAAVSLLAMVLMAAVATYALMQRADARTEARRAKASGLIAEAGALIPVVPPRVDPELGLLLAAEAARSAPSERGADSLRRALLVSQIRRVLPERGVTALSFDRRGALALATSDGSVRFYRGPLGRRLTSIRVGRPVTGVVTSPNGALVLTTERGAPARTWRRSTGEPLREFGRAPSAASFSPDGSLVLTVDAGSARIWRAGDGSSVATLRDAAVDVRAASFGPDGLLVATFGTGRVVRVSDARTGRLVAAVDQGGGVTSATLIPGDPGLVTTGRNRTARVWTLRGGGRLVHELGGHEGQVSAGAVSADGDVFVTAGTDGSARVWALPSGQLIADLVGHPSHVDGVALSRDGLSVVTWSSDGLARVSDTGSGALRVNLMGPGGAITGAAFDRSGELVVTTSADGRARIWRSRVDADLRLLARVPMPVAAAAFSVDGRVAATVARSRISVLRTADGRRMALLPASGATTVAVSPDGARVAAARGRLVSIWHLPDRAADTLDPGGATTAVAFSPEERELALGTAAGTIRLSTLEGRRGETIARVRRVTSLAFNPAGDLLAAGLADGAVAVWDLRNRRQLFERQRHVRGTPVLSVAFSPDGRQIVTAGQDSTVGVSNATTGEPAYSLQGHFAAVGDAAFSPDGRWIVTAGPGTAGLWDVPSRQRMLFLRGHTGRLLAATFDATGRRITTIGADGTLRAYRCDVCAGIEEIVQLAERRLRATGRKLRPAERSRYFGGS